MRQKVKTGLDVAMTFLLLIEMGYHMTGEEIHKWLGIILSALFIIHHILNWKWYKSLLRGKYTPARIFRTAVNLLLTIAMAGMVISGMMMARDIFVFIPLRANHFARLLHMASTAWGYVLMSLHIGLHWNMAVGKLKKRSNLTKPFSWAVRGFVIVAAAYGMYAFVRRDLGKHMFLLVQYAFFDFGEPWGLFFLDYFSILVLCAAVSYYLLQWLSLWKTRSV